MIAHSIDLNRHSFQAVHDSAEVLMQSRFQFGVSYETLLQRG